MADTRVSVNDRLMALDARCDALESAVVILCTHIQDGERYPPVTTAPPINHALINDLQTLKDEITRSSLMNKI